MTRPRPTRLICSLLVGSFEVRALGQVGLNVGDVSGLGCSCRGLDSLQHRIPQIDIKTLNPRHQTCIALGILVGGLGFGAPQPVDSVSKYLRVQG